MMLDWPMEFLRSRTEKTKACGIRNVAIEQEF
jgi:hypothetical protein